MIISMITSTGRTIHVCTDSEPVFQSGEIMAMSKAGMLPNEAEMIARIKATFPGANLEMIETSQDVYYTNMEDKMAVLNFNIDEAPDSNPSYNPLPAGEYKVMIVNTEMKQTKAGDGQFLKVEMDLLDGQFAGRKVFDNLNLDNPNQQTMEIARSTLKSICNAVGIRGVLMDSQDLHNTPIIIKLGLEVRKDTGENQNRVKGYKPITIPIAAPVAAARPAVSTAAPIQQAGAATPPWLRKAT